MSRLSFRLNGLAIAIAAMPLLVSASASAETEAKKVYKPTHSDFGGVGLMQMPSARMDDHGEFSFTYYDNEEYRRMALNLQLFPWLETTIRYNDIRTRLYSSSEGFSGDQTYKDRGVDVKARLWQESYYWPEISVGMRDMAGTGIFSSEFIVASKRVGNFDFTLGMGWGQLGQQDNISNPLCDVADHFCERATGISGRGGDFEVDEWFSGPAALFGGVEYQTPWPQLVLKAEYDGNDYQADRAGVPIVPDSDWNFGADYAVNDHVHLKVSYERGNTWMFGFTVRTNFNDMGQVKRRPDKVAAAPAPERDIAAVKQDLVAESSRMQRAQQSQAQVEEQAQNQSASDLEAATAEASSNTVDDRLLVDKISENAGYYVRRMGFKEDGRVFSLQVYQGRYRDSGEGLERLGRILAQTLPASVETYEVIDMAGKMQLATTRIDAKTFRTAILREDFDTQISDSYTRQDVDLTASDGDSVYQRQYQMGMPYFSVKPFLEQSFGNPESFYLYQVGLNLSTFWSFTENTGFYSRIGGNLVNNYDEFNFTVDAYDLPLPRVRTYVREYVTQSDIWLANLQITHEEQLSENLYGSVYGGYLERMFGGVGTEFLYRKMDANWAVGVDVNWVKQRSFENHLGFRDYDTVTGHVTGYWKPEFMPNTKISVAAGRFLAKDDGVQVNFEHKFKSGIIVGAYAAKTNVSAEDFGEGSFTKGFYISIPIDMLQLRDSVQHGTIGWSPITRDGGQMLNRQSSLYRSTEARSRFYTE